MNKTHHPHNRAERLRLKTKKLVNRPKDRPNPDRRRVLEEVKAKELDDEARSEILGNED